MPPRRRQKLSQAPSLTSSPQPKTPPVVEDSEDQTVEHLLNDPWTDEEEIGLLKGLIKWKPTGIHKHFHLLALHAYMLNNGYIHPKADHTQPAGIWRKLNTLYNLDTLDERENARQLGQVHIPGEYRVRDTSEETSSAADDDADVYSVAANKIENEDFDLMGEGFAELKWARRLAPDRQRRGESPPVLPELNMAEEPPVRFTPSFSIEPSEVATPASRKPGRGRAATLTATKGQLSTAKSTRRSTRNVEGTADEDEGNAAEEGEAEEEDAVDNSAGEDEEAHSETSTPAPRSTRSVKPTRGRPAGRARGRPATRRK